MDASELDLARQGCRVALERCQAVIDHLTPEQYAQAPEPHSSVGAHVRHVLDYFACFLRGLAGASVDYDARERNPALEHNPDIARQAIAQATARLEALNSDDPLEVCYEVAPGGMRPRLPSTISRELAFLSFHAVHHVALMVMTANLMGIELPHGMGLAYSTKTYLDSQEG